MEKNQNNRKKEWLVWAQKKGSIGIMLPTAKLSHKTSSWLEQQSSLCLVIYFLKSLSSLIISIGGGGLLTPKYSRPVPVYFGTHYINPLGLVLVLRWCLREVHWLKKYTGMGNTLKTASHSDFAFSCCVEILIGRFIWKKS